MVWHGERSVIEKSNHVLWKTSREIRHEIQWSCAHLDRRVQETSTSRTHDPSDGSVWSIRIVCPPEHTNDLNAQKRKLYTFVLSGRDFVALFGIEPPWTWETGWPTPAQFDYSNRMRTEYLLDVWSY